MIRNFLFPKPVTLAMRIAIEIEATKHKLFDVRLQKETCISHEGALIARQMRLEREQRDLQLPE